MVKNLNYQPGTRHVVLEAGSLTTSLSSTMLGCPLSA
jgi:hypothetical protein